MVAAGTSWTVGQFILTARILLQDVKNTPYRYGDDQLVLAMNIGLKEIKRLRADVFLGQSAIPQFDGSTNSMDVVPLDPMYHSALLYYMCGHAQLRDDEEVQDQRAAAFFAMFRAQLTTVA